MGRTLKISIAAGIAVSLVQATALAAVTYWMPGATPDPTEWTDPGNWSHGVPGPDDHAIIHSFTPWPVIDSNVGTVAILTPSWHSGVDSQLTIGPGGAMTVGVFMRMSQSVEGTAPSSGTLNISGGHMVVNIMQLGFNDAGDGLGSGYVNINSGFLHCGALGFGVAPAWIDIQPAPNTYLFLNGDQTAQVEAWAAAGKITGGGGVLPLKWAYDSPNPGLTAVWAVPEPGLIALLGFGGLTLLRRRR